MTPLDCLNDCVLLHILEYLDVISLTRVQSTSRRLFISAYRVLTNSPSIVSESGIGPHSFKSVVAKLASTPTFALIVGERMNQRLSNFVSTLQNSLPKSTHVVLAKCTSVLKPFALSPNSQIPHSKANRKRSSAEDIGAASSTAESTAVGDYTVLLASLPDTQCASLYVRVSEDEPPIITDESLRSYGLYDVDQEWELFIVFASPTLFIEEFIAGLQSRYPRAVIVGGVCHQQVALFQYHQFRCETDSIACLALRGRVPVRAIVSRGHDAASPVFDLPPSKLTTAQEGQYNFLQVTGICPAGRTEVLNPGVVMGDIINAHHDTADIYMIGSRHINATPPSSNESLKPDQGTNTGFHLQLVTEDAWQPRSISFAVESRLPVPNQLRFFTVNGETCARDMEEAMALAKKRFALDGQSVLGTVMFTCSGRGPHSYFFGRSDFDAQVYRGHFPNAPLLGCYVDGEIGPQLLGDIDRETALFASSATQSSVQGYTAVFCLFAAPPRRSIPEMMASLQPLVEHTRAQMRRGQTRQRSASFAQATGVNGGSCGVVSSSNSSGNRAGELSLVKKTSATTTTTTTAGANAEWSVASAQEEESAVVQSILRIQRARSSKSRSRSNSMASVGSNDSGGGKR